MIPKILVPNENHSIEVHQDTIGSKQKMYFRTKMSLIHESTKVSGHENRFSSRNWLKNPIIWSVFDKNVSFLDFCSHKNGIFSRK